jgi:outer membrane protein assembly factor BamB
MKAVRIVPIVILLLVTILAASCGPATRASGATAPAAPAAATPSSVAPPGTVAAGQLAWKFKAGDMADYSPAVSGGVVYAVGNDALNPADKRFAGSLYALDAATGAVRWKSTIAGGQWSAPVVSGDLLYVGAWDTYLHALDAATGTERWKFKTGDDLQCAPVVSGGVVYAGSAATDESGQGSLFALDAATGALLWTFKTDGPVSDSTAVSGGFVYVVSSGGTDPGTVYALDAATGAERWTFATGGWGFTPAVSGGLVYVGTNDNYLYALDATTGAKRWKSEVAADGAPAVSGGVIYAGSNDGYLHALDAASGVERWSSRTSGWVWSSPAVSGGLVFAADPAREDRGYVYAFDAASGTERWKFEVMGIHDSSAVVVGGLVYVGSHDGYIYAVTTGTAALATTEAGFPSTDSTIAPPPETTTELSTTTGIGDAESPTESTTAAAPEVAKYVSEFMAWMALYSATESADLERLEDRLSDEGGVTALTAVDLQVADRATVHLHEVADLLRSIEAPPEAAGIQKKIVAGFEARVAMYDKELLAMRNRDQAGAEAAKAAIYDSSDSTDSDDAMDQWMQEYGALAGWGQESPPTTSPGTQYEAAMMAWNKAFRDWADIGDAGFEITLDIGERVNDPVRVAGAHGFGDKLRAIQPPAALAAVHQKLVDAYDAWLAVLDKRIAPGAGPDPTAYQNAETAYEGAMVDWLIALFPSSPLLG